jgi:hypothetical protein
LLKELVEQTIAFNENYSEIIKEHKKKHLKTSRFDFRFSFFLREKNIQSFNNCIENRLITEYSNNCNLQFEAHVEYKNNDILKYDSIDSLFNSTHEYSMLRIYLIWTYILPIEINTITFPMNYTIEMRYEIEQNSDNRENFLLEEWGCIFIEGSKNDWNNTTLAELKILVKSTKMPPWWYYPKKGILYIREYINTFIWFGVFAFVLAVIIPLIYDGEAKNKTIKIQREAIILKEQSDYIEKSRQITDVAEKIQSWIEYNLTPFDLPAYIEKRFNYFLYYFLVFVIGGTVSIIIIKLFRHIFPQSAILIGSNKNREENKILVYNFIWGAIIICSLMVPFILTKVSG